MAAGAGRNDGRWQIVFGAIVTAGLVILGSSAVCAASDPVNATIAASAMGMAQSKLVYLKPGLRIGKKPPEGWTHLVMKSTPRLASGELGSMPAGSKKTATLFHSVILANIKPVDINEKDFELTQIGIGICIPDPQDESQDIVVSADTLDALGLRHLTMVQRVVLDAAELELAAGRIIARTTTFALFRSPVVVVTQGATVKHVSANIHYGFCVNRTTGRLDVAAWLIKPETRPVALPTTLVKLASPAVFTCDLDVRTKRILGTVPYSWSFAMQALPPGRRIEVTPALGARLVDASTHPATSDPEEVERLLEKAMAPFSEGDVATDRMAPRTDGAVRNTAIPPPYRTSR